MQKSYYFQHDYNASTDAKVLFLRQQLGMEGYGIFWFILESLAQAGGFLPLKIVPVLAMQSQTQETKVRAVIEGYDLFQIIDEQFFSPRMNVHLKIRKLLSEEGRKGALKRWGNGLPISPPIAPPNAKERKGKEIKESKEINISPTLNEFLEYCSQLNGIDFKALEFSLKAKYDQWSENNWKDGHGNKIKNWKTKIRNTIPHLKPIYVKQGTSEARIAAAKNF